MIMFFVLTRGVQAESLVHAELMYYLIRWYWMLETDVSDVNSVSIFDIFSMI